MKWLLTLLAGGLGPWLLGGVAAAVLGFAGWGLWNAHDLDVTRRELALAKAGLTDPATRRTWQAVAASAQTDLATCKANLDGSNADLAALSAATRAKADQDAASLARTGKALSAARKSNAALDQLIDNLKEPLPAGEVCARVIAFDAKVIEGLRGMQ